MIRPERIRVLNDKPARGDGRYVLYWMQQSQRAAFNHALEFAVREANERSLPVVVGFGLTDDFPEANARHYAFMLEGLADARGALASRGIALVVRRGPPARVALELARDAALVVADRGYLRVQRGWRDVVAAEARCAVVRVEADVVVPVDAASDHEEYAARTLRPKIGRLLPLFLAPLRETVPQRSSLGMGFDGLDISNPPELLGRLAIDRSVGPVREFVGGHTEARRRLDDFVARKLAAYDEARNMPGCDGVSHLSPYFHFGHISPVEVALAVRNAAGRAGDANVDAFIEQLVVRRELAMNFCESNPRYDVYEGAVPDWARRTLAGYAAGPRAHAYSFSELDAAATHDECWNAAQREMVRTGKMHNYMRMYWGKKLVEWCESPGEAFATALRLNNRYELDGRDPNSFAGVAWCFGKHDRPWAPHPFFGTVRSMTEAGLRRKFDMKPYLAANGAGGDGQLQ